MLPKQAPLVRLVTWANARLAVTLDFLDRNFSGVWRVVSAPFRWIWRVYSRQIWNRFARNRDGRVTPKRAGWTVLGTVIFLAIMPTVLHLGWQVALFQTTWKDEVIYLTSAEEIDPENEIHSIRGCRQLPCAESDSVYFRVRSSVLHDAHAMWTKGHRFYPEEVAGVVAPGVNRCEVRSYGIRVKALMRGWGIYPDMVDAICVPYTDEGKAISLPSDG